MKMRISVKMIRKCGVAAVTAGVAFAATTAKGALRAWKTVDYVQGELELHLDGIHNTGAESVHDFEATTWKDLSGNGRDAELQKDEGSTSVWRTDGMGFYFARDAWFQTSAVFSLGTTYTIEILSSFTRSDTADQNATFVSSSGAVSSCQIFYKKSDSIFFRGDNTFGSSWKNSPALQGASQSTYVTAIRDGSCAALITGTEFPTTTNSVTSGYKVLDWFQGGKNVAAPEEIWLIGGSEVDTGGDKFIGTIKSVRFYSRLLSEDELAWNRAIDNARFTSATLAITATPVKSAMPNAVIATSEEGLNGVEACGSYVVDEDGYAFTALAAISAGGVTNMCAGYTLETWNGTAWGAPETHAGEMSCFVSADDKVRITWLWTPTTGYVTRASSLASSGAIVVESAVKGLPGREPDGIYNADGWTFTPHEGVRMARGFGWRCIGYQLQTWNAATSAWGEQETVIVQTGSPVEYVSPSRTTYASKRLIWLWKQVQAARTAADYSTDDYAYGALELHLDGKSHGQSADTWSDLSGKARDAALAVSDGGSGNDWNDGGFYFNASAYFLTDAMFSLGHSSTMEIFADATISQPQASGTLFAPTIDVNSGAVFYKKANKYLSYRADKLIWSGVSSAYKYRPSIVNPSTISHLTAARDGKRAAIFTETSYPANEENVPDDQAYLGWSIGKSDLVPDASQWSVGGVPGDASYAFKGTIKSVRAYNRLLTEDELAWNREVDTVRFSSRLTTTNVVVVAGGEGSVQAETGDYKVEGEWTFTASKVLSKMGTVVDVKRYALEEFVNGAWVGRTIYEGASYTYTVGVSPAKVRLTWLACPSGMSVTFR